MIKKMMETLFDILVVEDEPVVFKATEKLLIPEGFKLDSAVDAETALKKLQQHNYRLILSDLMLPKVSGFEFVEMVREKFPKTPIIMITGYATFENVIQAFRVGAFDFIPKPFDMEELLGVVKRSIQFSEKGGFPLKEKQQREGLHKQQPRANLENICFLGQHAWVKLDPNGSAVIGIGEAFSKSISDFYCVEFPAINEEMTQGGVCVRIITEEQLVNIVWAPLSGKVVEINHEVEQDVKRMNRAHFVQNWLVRILPTNLENEWGALSFGEPGL